MMMEKLPRHNQSPTGAKIDNLAAITLHLTDAVERLSTSLAAARILPHQAVNQPHLDINSPDQAQPGTGGHNDQSTVGVTVRSPEASGGFADFTGVDIQNEFDLIKDKYKGTRLPNNIRLQDNRSGIKRADQAHKLQRYSQECTLFRDGTVGIVTSKRSKRQRVKYRGRQFVG